MPGSSLWDKCAARQCLWLQYLQTHVTGDASRKHADPLKPRFYIVKVGLTGVYIVFLISALKHRLRVLTDTHNLCFEQKYEKISDFLSEIFSFWR